MAQNFLAILSPTFCKKTKKTAERRAMIVSCLNGKYELPEGGADKVIKLARQEGYTETLSREIVYYDAGMSRKAYLFLNGDDGIRNELCAERNGRRDGELLGIKCLLKDNSDITTWEDVQRKVAERIPPRSEFEPVAGNVKVQEQLPAAQEEMLESPVPIEELIHLLHTALKIVDEYGPRFIAWVNTCQLISTQAQGRIAALERENGHLRREIKQYRTTRSAAFRVATELTQKVKKIDDALLLRESGLPFFTQVSDQKTGWDAEYEIVYEEAFRERFFGSYLVEHEKVQMLKAIQNYAKEGLYYPGLNRKKFTRHLPGIPTGIRNYWYLRSADDIRFTTKKIGQKVHILTVHNKNELV